MKTAGKATKTAAGKTQTTKAETTKAAASKAQTTKTETTKAQTTKVEPLGAPPNGSSSAVISMGGFIGMMLLFAIPIVGWLICIIMAIVSSNANRRNFARATLVFLLIGLVFSVVMFFLYRFLWGIVGGFMLPFLTLQ
jgi:MFS family permease